MVWSSPGVRMLLLTGSWLVLKLLESFYFILLVLLRVQRRCVVSFLVVRELGELGVLYYKQVTRSLLATSEHLTTSHLD